MEKTYKTLRKYKCPYCNIKATRMELVDHVYKNHAELIPENYTAARAVYDYINGKNYGICMICKKKVYEWNDKVNKYKNLCDDPKCRAKVREIALERHMKVYNKPTLLNDPEQQEKMLANRRISGTYIFSDGTKMTYTGKYEKSALEFMDKVLNIPAEDIQAPGPVLEYEYDGKVHKWITDIYYIPANLLIEIKDGGSNPNNRPMQSYRDKQIAKETMITDLGKFNYVRLTNNNFAQLLEILADIKNEALSNDNPDVKIHINEEVGGLPRNGPPEAYIIPYGMNNVFDGFAYSDSDMDDQIMITDDDGSLIAVSESELLSKFDVGPVLIYKKEDVFEKIKKIHESIKLENKNIGPLYFAEMLLNRQLYKYEEVLLSESFVYYDKEREKRICKLIENASEMQSKGIFEDLNVIKTIGVVKICQSPNGYYAITPGNFYMASEYFSDVESLISSDVVKLMNDIYNKNSKIEYDGSDEDEY